MRLHRVREGLKEERTACINQIRGLLAEFGLVFGKSPKVLRAVLAEVVEVVEDASNELSTMARLVLQRAFDHWRELDEHMRWCDQQVGRHVRSSPAAQRAAKLTGIGELARPKGASGTGTLGALASTILKTSNSQVADGSCGRSFSAQSCRLET